MDSSKKIITFFALTKNEMDRFGCSFRSGDIYDDERQNFVDPKTSPKKGKTQDYSISFFDELLRVYHNSDYDFLEKHCTEILRLAGQKNPDAQYFAGLCYHKGLGVPKNYQIAKQLYENSVQKENPAAMNNLGTIFEEQKNFKMAEKYYRMAAEYSFAISIRNICLLKLRSFESLNSELDYYLIDKYAFSGITITEENKYQPKRECLAVNYICAYLGVKNATSFSDYCLSNNHSFSTDDVNLVKRYTEKANTYLENMNKIEKLFFERYGYQVVAIELVTNDCLYIGEYYKKISDSQAKVIPVYEEKKEYSDGVYSGYMVNGKRHGKGTFILNNGDVYEGDFSEDLFHGHGKYTKIDGSFYEGEFFNGNMHGKGKITYADQCVYEGDFYDGKHHGQGKFIHYNGGFYEGEYCFGKWNGKGRMSYPDGKIYEGDFCDGKIQGYGKMFFPNSGEYTGEFKDGRFHGKGELRFDDGTTFKGTFENGEIIETGTIIRKNGQIIEGKKGVWLAKKLRKLFKI